MRTLRMEGTGTSSTLRMGILWKVGFSFLLLAAAWFGVAESAFAAPQAETSKTQLEGPKTQSKDPIHINSDRMEAYNKKNLIVFIGNVSAVQGAMQIQSDRLEVYVKKNEEKDGKAGKKEKGAMPASRQGASPGVGERGSVDRLVATGNVLINQGKEKFASGERLDYKEATGIAVLTGRPRAWENNNQVVGTKIEIFLRDGRTVVHGSRKRRVSVTLYPESSPAGTAKGSKK